MDLQGGWKIIAECDPETRSRRDLDSESDDEELNSKSIGWPMNETLVPPNAILDPKRLAFKKCDDFSEILDKNSPQRQWISWVSSVKSCSPQKRSKERNERRSRLGKGKSIEASRGKGKENKVGKTTQDITFVTEALVLERERNNANDGMLKGKVVMFGVSHEDDAEFRSLPIKSPKMIYYPRPWGCRDKITSFSEDKAKNLAEKLLNPIFNINQREKNKVTQNDENIIISRIKHLIKTYHFPIKFSTLNFKTHILSLPWKIQYELLKKVQVVLKFDTTNFFTPADQNTKDYNKEYPINLECSMGMETQLTYTLRYPYTEEVLTLYLHHLQKLCSFPESCVPQNLLGTELDQVLQPRLNALEDADVNVKKESDSYSKIMCKLLESFRISCSADSLLLHDVLYINSFKITIYNATQNKVGFYVNYFPDLKLVKNYEIFYKNKETSKNSLGTVTRLVQCYKDKDIEALHKEIFLRKVNKCPEIKTCQKYPINKYFKHKDILELWDDCSEKNYSLAKFIELSKDLNWDDDKWADETGDLSFNGFLFALLFNNEEGFYPILLSFDKQKQQNLEQYIKDVYSSRFYMYKPITDKMKTSNSLYIRNVPATYAQLKSNVDVYKYKRRPKEKQREQREKQSKRPRRRLRLSRSPAAAKKSDSPPAAKKSYSPPAAKKSDSPPAAKKSNSPAAAKKSKSPPAAKKSKSPPAAKKSDSPPAAKKSDSPPAAKKSDSPPGAKKSDSPPAEKKSDSPPKITKFLADRKYVQIVTNNKKCADINQEKDPHELISWNCKPYKGEGGDDTVNQWFAYNDRTSHIISAITDKCLYVNKLEENERVHQGDCNKAHNEWKFEGKNIMLKDSDFALYTSKEGYFIISKKLPKQEYTLRKSPKTKKKYLHGINFPALDV